MDKFDKLLMKKKKEGREMSPEEKQAKMGVLQDLKSQMSKHMADGIKKVTVASDSPEGLKKGLEKAEDMVEEKLASSEEPEMEDSEESEDEEEMIASPEEIDAKIQKLMELKKKLQA
jgi:hypothetical protein